MTDKHTKLYGDQSTFRLNWRLVRPEILILHPQLEALGLNPGINYIHAFDPQELSNIFRLIPLVFATQQKDRLTVIHGWQAVLLARYYKLTLLVLIVPEAPEQVTLDSLYLLTMLNMQTVRPRRTVSVKRCLNEALSASNSRLFGSRTRTARFQFLHRSSASRIRKPKNLPNSAGPK